MHWVGRATDLARYGKQRGKSERCVRASALDVSWSTDAIRRLLKHTLFGAPLPVCYPCPSRYVRFSQVPAFWTPSAAGEERSDGKALSVGLEILLLLLRCPQFGAFCAHDRCVVDLHPGACERLTCAHDHAGHAVTVGKNSSR
jgi:hypothetical protein